MIVNFRLESRSTRRDYEAENWTNLLNLSYAFPGFKTTLWGENFLSLWFPPQFKSALDSEVGHLKYIEIDLSDLDARNQWLEAGRLFSTVEEICLTGDSNEYRPLPPVRVKELRSWKDCATFEKAKQLVLARSLTFDVAAVRLFQNLNLENVTSLVFHARIYGKHWYPVNVGEALVWGLECKRQSWHYPSATQSEAIEIPHALRRKSNYIHPDNILPAFSHRRQTHAFGIKFCFSSFLPLSWVFGRNDVKYLPRKVPPSIRESTARLVQRVTSSLCCGR
jgi:hypothetical protein